jgi:hypothetical protein
MKRFIIGISAFLFAAALAFGQAKPRPIPTGPESVLQSQPNLLFNGWKLSPAGRHVGVNSMPLKMVLSPDGKTLAAVCSGQWNGIALIDQAPEDQLNRILWADVMGPNVPYRTPIHRALKLPGLPL